jgi:hypothetical protein
MSLFFMFILTAGGTVGRLAVVQTGVSEVLVTWDPPIYLPVRGYQFMVHAKSDVVDIVLPKTERSRTVTLHSSVQDLSVQIRPLSMHYPSVTKSVDIRIRGEKLHVQAPTLISCC